jgi:hypothetical protein
MGSASSAPDRVLALPKGGGAQQAIGETFTPDLFTGTGNASIALLLPPGRNGLAPSLSLNYSSGNGNGLFGVGWTIAIPQVVRRTVQGVPRYDENDQFIAGGDTLVPRGDGSFVPRTDAQFSRIDRCGENWRIRTREGDTSSFGDHGPGVDEVGVIADPAKPERIFAWLLRSVCDPCGNRVAYAYQDAGSRDAGYS